MPFYQLCLGRVPLLKETKKKKPLGYQLILASTLESPRPLENGVVTTPLNHKTTSEQFQTARATERAKSAAKQSPIASQHEHAETHWPMFDSGQKETPGTFALFRGRVPLLKKTKKKKDTGNSQLILTSWT